MLDYNWCLAAVKQFNKWSKLLSSSLLLLLQWWRCSFGRYNYLNKGVVFFKFWIMASEFTTDSFAEYPYVVVSQDSVVGIVIGYWLEDGGFRVRAPVGSRIFSSARRPDRLLGSPSLLQMCTGALSPGVKRQGCEANPAPPTSAEVKKMWIYTSTPPYAFMAQCLIS
jgi:hypothetical protein